MRKFVLLMTAVGAAVATAVPAQAAAPDPIPWGEDIVIIPGACVTEPCPYPYTVHVPDRPF